MAKKWIQKATKEMKRKGTVGSFSAAAKRADKSTGAYAKEVLANPKDFSPTTRKRAQFAENVIGLAEGGMAEEVAGIHSYDVTHGSGDVSVEWGRPEMDWKSHKLIRGTQAQVRGRYYNDNDGEGTF